MPVNLDISTIFFTLTHKEIEQISKMNASLS